MKINPWPTVGSAILVLGAVGHFILVDLSVVFLEADYIKWIPGSLLPQMKSTVINFDILGENKVLNIFSGFSIWVVFSLMFIAYYNFLIFHHLPLGHPLRLHAIILGLVVSLVFLVVASLCYIYPPVFGGLLAIACFAISWRKELEATQNFM